MDGTKKGERRSKDRQERRKDVGGKERGQREQGRKMKKGNMMGMKE